jgi:hypothetical protein
MESQAFTVYSGPNDGYVYEDNANWTTLRSAASGSEVNSTTPNTATAIMARHDAGLDYGISRSFFEFDLSELSGGGRTIQSVILDLVASSNNESNVMVQEGTQSASLGTGDFDSFTGSILAGPFDMEVFDTRNLIYFDSTSYVVANLGGTVKFCVREYDHDYSDSTPGNSTNYRNGVYYIEHGYASPLRTPRLIINYLKTPDWTAHFDNTQWSIGSNGSWDGSKYTTSSDTLNLDTPTFASGYKPYKIRITFTGATSIWVELNNTDGSANLFDGDEQFTSGEEKVINNYNNFDIAELDIFNYDSGDFDVTNIEFLEP